MYVLSPETMQQGQIYITKCSFVALFDAFKCSFGCVCGHTAHIIALHAGTLLNDAFVFFLKKEMKHNILVCVLMCLIVAGVPRKCITSIIM